VYAQLGANLPAATRMMVSISEWVSFNFGKILFSIFGVLFGIWLISKTRRGGYVIDTIKLNSPVFGSLVEQSI
jgi:type II secretory pathway component PulF